MTQLPSTRARHISRKSCIGMSIQNDISIQLSHTVAPRNRFKRSALCTALATSLIGMTTGALADTANTNITDQPTDNQVPNSQAANGTSATLSNNDTQLDTALDALRLKNAVEQGIIDQSVLDNYSKLLDNHIDRITGRLTQAEGDIIVTHCFGSRQCRLT